MDGSRAWVPGGKVRAVGDDKLGFEVVADSEEVGDERVTEGLIRGL